jgi:hypothetical protein
MPNSKAQMPNQILISNDKKGESIRACISFGSGILAFVVPDSFIPFLAFHALPLFPPYSLYPLDEKHTFCYSDFQNVRRRNNI